jgi:HTH-type transcriptional regulator/antitoxin HigA
MIKSDNEYGRLRKKMFRTAALKHRLCQLLSQLGWQDQDMLTTLDDRINLISQLLSEYHQRHTEPVDVDSLLALKDLPVLLIRARLAAGWSQRELAKQVGLSKSQLSRLEVLQYAPAKLCTAIKIADILGKELIDTRDS